MIKSYQVHLNNFDPLICVNTYLGLDQLLEVLKKY